MNNRKFSIYDFKNIILNLIIAHTGKDGVALQKLEAEIIDTYKETTMSHHQYTTLIGICEELLEDWRMNDK